MFFDTLNTMRMSIFTCKRSYEYEFMIEYESSIQFQEITGFRTLNESLKSYVNF